MLRKEKVVGKFVEFFGAGVSTMAVADRATIGNMAPEYGATMGFFPVDDQTLRYLRQTGRTKAEVDLVERYTKEQGLFRTDRHPCRRSPRSFDSTFPPSSQASPARSGRKIASPFPNEAGLAQGAHGRLRQTAAVNGSPEGRWEGEGGHKIEAKAAAHPTPAAPDLGFSGVPVKWNDKVFRIKHGDVVIAAITSCTNTSNPSVMVAAGLLAKKAVEKGLTVPPHVKTSLAPGSRVVTDYFEKAGLDTVPRKARLLHRRLRLHDLHRQQRPAARADLRSSEEKRPRRRRRPLRQPQLRRPHQPAT